VGIGVAGNVAADALSMPIDRPLGLKAVTNPAAATGGVDPDTAASARRSIPVPVLTLGRVVSRRDYADFALAFSGVGMADAAILPLRGGPVVIVSVADEEGAPPPQSTLDRLDAELTRYGDPGARHRVVPCRTGLFRIALSVVVDPARTPAVVGAAVEAALRAAFAAPVRGIARAVERSAVIALAASVPGVLGVDLDRLYRTAGFPSLQLRLLPQPVRAVGVNVRGAEILSLSPDPFDWLEVRT
jgi:predicted phage baseplate assembly protein